MNGTLRAYFLVQQCVGYAVYHCGIAQLFVERCLIIEPRCHTERQVSVPAWRDVERCAWRYDALAVEVPMCITHAVIQTIQRWNRVVALEVPRILQVCFYAFGVQVVACTHRIYHIESFASVRNVVACRVAVFVFCRIFFNLLYLIRQCALYSVVSCTLLHHQFKASHVCFQVVARMLHIRSYTQILRSFGLCEPVLPLNVVPLLLFGRESRRYERYISAWRKVVGDA